MLELELQELANTKFQNLLTMGRNTLLSMNLDLEFLLKQQLTVLIHTSLHFCLFEKELGSVLTRDSSMKRIIDSRHSKVQGQASTIIYLLSKSYEFLKRDLVQTQSLTILLISENFKRSSFLSKLLDLENTTSQKESKSNLAKLCQ